MSSGPKFISAKDFEEDWRTLQSIFAKYTYFFNNSKRTVLCLNCRVLYMYIIGIYFSFSLWNMNSFFYCAAVSCVRSVGCLYECSMGVWNSQAHSMVANMGKWRYETMRLWSCLLTYIYIYIQAVIYCLNIYLFLCWYAIYIYVGYPT